MDIIKMVKENYWQIFKITAMILLLIILLVAIGRILMGVSIGGNWIGHGEQSRHEANLGLSGGVDLWGGKQKMANLGLSMRNVAPSIAPGEPVQDYNSGFDAEEFEIEEYNAYIETRNKEEDCEKVLALKSRADIIFQSSREFDNGCNFRFKTTKDEESRVIELLQSLNPENLSENTYSIKNTIEDFTSKEEILRNKQDTIEKTLSDAVAAYDEITRIARSSQNADALANVIDSKIRTIERLTNEQISVSTQLDQLLRNKAEQLERLEFTYFYVSITESKYVDGDEIKSTWKMAIQQFVREVNYLVQDLTVGLVAFILMVMQYAIYLLIILFVAKFGWKFSKYIWQK